MESVFEMPFAIRMYPSPTTRQEVIVHVKEILLADFPDQFVERQFDGVWKRGRHLLPTDIRGTRAWASPEIERCVEQFGGLPREYPWMEVWEILTQDQIAVLDLVTFTGFYTDKTIKRFEEFSELAVPLIQVHGAIIKKASAGGVLLDVCRIREDEWNEAAEGAIAFNEKNFTVEQPRSTVLESWRTSKTLWFGYC